MMRDGGCGGSAAARASAGVARQGPAALARKESLADQLVV
jgi:hypothetical protein